MGTKRHLILLQNPPAEIPKRQIPYYTVYNRQSYIQIFRIQSFFDYFLNNLINTGRRRPRRIIFR